MASPNAAAGRRNELPDSAGSADPVRRLDRWLDSSPDKYFDELLKAVSVATEALAGQVWGLNETGRLVKVSSTDPVVFQQFDQPGVVNDHRNLLSKALFEGQLSSNTYLLRDGLTDIQRTLLLAPFHLEQESIGVVELILPREMEDQRLPVVNELLAHIAGYLSKRTQNRSPQSIEAANQPAAQTLESAAHLPGVGESAQSVPTDPATAVQANGRSGEAPASHRLAANDVEHFIWQLYQHVDLKHAAFTAVNETRRLLNCDRACMAIRRGRSTEVMAISGQDSVVRKSNTVRALREISDQAIASGQIIQIDFDEESLNQTDAALIAYFGETGALRLVVIPLLAPERIDFDSATDNAEKRTIAALVIEYFSAGQGPDVADFQRLVPHISQAMFHALDQEQIFLLPFRRVVGRWLEKTKLTQTKAYIAAAGLTLIVGLLIFVQVPYRVRATGKLMPAQQFRAYAPFDGESREILVRTGQRVEANQPLLHLYDETLETELLVLANSLEEKRKQLAAYKAQLDENAATLSQTEKIGLSAKIAQNSSEIAGLKLQLTSAQRLVAHAIVRTEISGTVATFRPEDLLVGRPVGRGELLVEVMNEQGPWNLELELPAKRFGHLLRATADNPSQLSVTFIQATAPEKTYDGVIQQISTRTSNDKEGSSVILIQASINDDQEIRRTIGAEVIAKISCGQKSLGYACFGDMLDWLRRRVW